MSKDKSIDIKYTRHLVKMDDGGQISIDWATPELNNIKKTGEKVCVIFPGLSGGSERGYIKNLVRTLINDGFEVAVLHNRGVAETEYTSPDFINLTSNEEYFKGLQFIR